MELGDLQLAVMEVVWESEDATVAEVHERLAADRSIAYTTVLSTLRGLERRGMLTHRAEGKAHRFYPAVSREDFTRRSVHSLVERLFRGRPEALMSHLLGNETVSAEELNRIRSLLDEEEDQG